MKNTDLQYPDQLLKKAYELLCKNNSDEESVLIFLTKLILFLYLGHSGHLDSFNLILNRLKSSSTPEALTAFLKNLFSSLAIKNDKESLGELPFINETYSLYIHYPEFSKELFDFLTSDTFLDFNWADLKALEFCHLFESLINATDKHNNGIFFTSKENIDKVIKPLFLENLYEKLEEILQNDPSKLPELLAETASLTFLDPASGVGNFLVETFNQLIKLETVILENLKANNIPYSGPRVSISQFYGIEIRPSSVAISKAVLLIADLEQKSRIKFNLIESSVSNHIMTANALRIDWNTVISNNKLSYIIGNPPFLGARLKNASHLKDLQFVFGKDWKHLGNLDYVAGWFKKAFDYMKGTAIKAAFVATSSLSEGVSPSLLFKPLIEDGFIINFAYKSFKWTHEYNDSTAVYVVIIGFSTNPSDSERYIITENKRLKVKHINGYLMDGPEVYAESRKQPICSVPNMGIGNKPVDGGNYLFKEEEYLDFIKREPESKKFFHPFYGTSELVKQKPRYCLWLGDENPENYLNLPLVMERVENVRNFRLSSTSKQTRAIADKPTKFHVENNPDTNYLVIPRISTNAREYLPIGYLTPNEMTSDSVLIVPGADLFHFGVLTSNLHMIWLNFVCGRLGEVHRYSKEIVYNNFPWPEASEEDKKRIEKTAEKILKVRERYPDKSFKILYNPVKMPQDLKQAHLENDIAVFESYHFDQNYTRNEHNLIMLLSNRYVEILEKKNKPLA